MTRNHPPLTPPTAYQLAVLDYIALTIYEQGIAPSRPEVSERFQTKGPGRLFRILAERGLISVRKYIPRGVTVTPAGYEAIGWVQKKGTRYVNP